MNISKITALEKKAKKEAQKAVDKIFKKYNKQLIELIAKEIPKGDYLLSGNGICTLMDKNDKEVGTGKAWGRSHDSDNYKMTYLSSLQYALDIEARFEIPQCINGIK